MVEELSLVRFGVTNFFAVLINSQPFKPISTLLIKLVEAIILAEPEAERDKESFNRVTWIYENTHKDVEIPLSIIELAVFKNLDKGLNREIEIGDKEYNLVELYKYLDEISKELAGIVVGIAKKYSLDIPLSAVTGSTQQKMISVEG
jgi:hypothetical protein